MAELFLSFLFLIRLIVSNIIEKLLLANIYIKTFLKILLFIFSNIYIQFFKIKLT